MLGPTYLTASKPSYLNMDTFWCDKIYKAERGFDHFLPILFVTNLAKLSFVQKSVVSSSTE